MEQNELNDLITQGIPLLKDTIEKKFPSYKGRYYAEMYSAGLAALWEAADGFDASKSSWATWVRLILVWRIKEGLRNIAGSPKKCRHRFKFLRKMRSLDFLLSCELSGDLPDRRIAGPCVEVERQDTRLYLQRITGKDWPVIRSILDDETQREIGLEEGVTESRISQRMKARLCELRTPQVYQNLAS